MLGAEPSTPIEVEEEGCVRRLFPGGRLPAQTSRAKHWGTEQRGLL